MDPYSVLGLSRDCTHDEAREAFLAKARSVHPDRGGEDAAFIQLRAAYERILRDVDRRPIASPETNQPHRAPSSEGATKPYDSTADADRAGQKKASEQKRPRGRPDPAIARQSHDDWLGRVSSTPVRRKHRRRWKSARLLGTLFLVFFMIWIPLAWIGNSVYEILAREAATQRPGLHSSGRLEMAAFVFLVAFLAACWVMCKYDSRY